MFDFVKSFGRIPLAAAGLTVLLGGCGISQYNALMNQRLTSLRVSVKFRNFYASSQLPDVPISVRIPTVFVKSYRENSSHKDDGAVINPDRLQPPFLKLPGFKLCYEGTNTTGTTTLPFYCYLAALPAVPGDADKIAAQLQAQLKKAFPETTAEWQGVDADTPDGKYLHWRKIHVEGVQPFQVKTNNKVDTQKLPGIFELWIYDADGYIVLIAWRTPTAVQGPSPGATDSASQMEALLKGPPKDAKLDLNELPTATAGTLTVDKAAAN
jgi:hypothetical protein